jgi:hypothetical protein
MIRALLRYYIKPASAQFWLGVLVIIIGAIQVLDLFHSLGLLGSILGGTFQGGGGYTILAGFGLIFNRAAQGGKVPTWL